MRRNGNWAIWAVALLAFGFMGCAGNRDWCGGSCRCSFVCSDQGANSTAQTDCAKQPPKTAPETGPTAEQQQPQADNAFAQAPAAGTEAESIGSPNMMGDFLRGFVSQQVGTVRISKFNGTAKFFVSIPIVVRIPEAGAGAKIAENESPRPQDRVFLTYNYYDNILPSTNGNSGFSSINLHAETLGGEMTLLNGDASLGVRVPIYQLVGPDVVSQDRLGDVSVIAKYAWINGGPDANLFSTGLMVTTPTSETTVGLFGERINSTIFQPFAGAVVQLGSAAFVHGFSSLAVPTDSHDATFFFNDVGVCYWLFRDSDGDWLTAVVPTVEVHANIPLDKQGARNEPVGALESVVLTEGVQLFFGASLLQIGVATPVTGPRPFDVEVIAQLNIRY